MTFSAVDNIEIAGASSGLAQVAGDAWIKGMDVSSASHAVTNEGLPRSAETPTRGI